MKTVCPCCGHEQEHDVILACLPPAYRCEKCHEVSSCSKWLTRAQVERKEKSFDQLHAEAMKTVQDEWMMNYGLHEEAHSASFGIKSSQISALVGVLVKKGILP